MNVVYLLQDSTRIYGLERATLDLLKGLSGGAVSPFVLLMRETRLSGESALAPAMTALGIEHEALTVRSRFSRELVRSIRDRLVSRRANVLHAAGFKADTHAGLAARWGAVCPVVSTVHGWLGRPDLKERFYGWLDRRALARFDRVIALSRYYEKLLASRGVPPARLTRIPSGLDLETLGEVPAPAGPFTVGILGRLSWEKNHAMFLRAAERSMRSGSSTRFLIAGDGPDRGAIEAEIAQRGLQEHVRLAGYMAREDFFAAAQVMTLTSRIENLPYTVMEAMAWRRPVVATAVGGLPDLVDDGRTGYLVPSDDDAALAAAFARLADDPALRDRLGAAGRRKLEAEFTLSHMVRQHEDLYRSLAARPVPGRSR